MEKLSFSWKEFPAIPPAAGESSQAGLAGPVAGSLGEVLLVAGGANFTGGLPWKGGTKQYHSEIFLLRKLAGDSIAWEQSITKLPYNQAYAACVSLPQGVIAIGGENESGLLRSVLLFSLKDDQVDIKYLPDLPAAISAGGATAAGSRIFLAGGLDSSGASCGFFCLDMSNMDAGWKRLADLPVALSHAVVVSQKDESGECIYVISGRNKTGSVTSFMSSIWKYSINGEKWNREGDIMIDGQLTGLSAGMGLAAGTSSIVLFGGDMGVIFNQTERLNAALESSSGVERSQLFNQKDSLLTNHPGFGRGILVYNTITKIWTAAGEIPFETPVTTTAFFWDGWAIIPSGEVRPGIRTPRVLAVEINITK